MSHTAEHHIEHAEHAVHASHSSFDRSVTISIAIIAAVLACATMLSHRAHTETLKWQAMAARQTTEASNKWNYYQAKNVFLLESEIMLDQLQVLPAKADAAELPKIKARYKDNVVHYKKKLPEIKAEAEEMGEKSNEFLKEAAHVHALADRYDYGELALQLAVVLCSLSILTKGRGFWFTGLICAVIGVLIAFTGFLNFFMPAH
jgi:hypothetical protein